MNNKPIENSYNVDERVYAGEYAGDKFNPKDKIQSLLDFGITHFIDLTEEGDLDSYKQYIPENCCHCRFPIRDVSVPKECKSVYELMKYIDIVISNPDNKVYIHCWGGVGRTGLIVGCYYVYRGETAKQALEHLSESFKQCPKSEHRRTPETREQIEFIRDFACYKELIEH